jgi:hypothetical protein
MEQDFGNTWLLLHGTRLSLKSTRDDMTICSQSAQRSAWLLAYTLIFIGQQIASQPHQKWA